MKQSDFSLGLALGLVIGVLAILLAHPVTRYAAVMPKPEAGGNTSADGVIKFTDARARGKLA